MTPADHDKDRLALIAHLQTIARPGVDIGKITESSNLFDAGALDSLAVVEIILYLEQTYSIDFRRSSIDPARLASINDILQIIIGATK